MQINNLEKVKDKQNTC